MASSRMTPTPTPTSTASAANEATISRLNVGPMTTAFEPPARCFDRTLNSGVSTTLQQGGLEFADDLSMFITDIRSAEEICPSASIFPCLPHFRKYRELKGPHLFYSPGIACPKGWQTVASVMGSNTPNSLRYINGIVASTLLPGESAFICCPIGFEYIVNFPPAPPVVYCASSIRNFGSSHKYWSCSGNSTLAEMSKTDAGYVMTLTTTSGGQTSQMQISFMTIKIYAPTIQLNRRQHDVPASLTTEVHTKQRPGKIPATIEQSPASRLGPGAIAGIVIGAVGCLALLVIMITLLPANARKRRSAKDNSKHELDGTGAAARTELEASERHELDAEGENQIYELQDNSTLGGTTPKTDDADASAVSRYKRWSGRRLGW